MGSSDFLVMSGAGCSSSEVDVSTPTAKRPSGDVDLGMVVYQKRSRVDHDPLAVSSFSAKFQQQLLNIVAAEDEQEKPFPFQPNLQIESENLSGEFDMFSTAKIISDY